MDARKAYVYGVPERTIYVRLPYELELGKNVVGKLVRCMYGTRDAGAIWESCYTKCLVDLGFVQGAASPCCFTHPEWKVSVVVHGDDFTALGSPDVRFKHLAGHTNATPLVFKERYLDKLLGSEIGTQQF